MNAIPQAVQSSSCTTAATPAAGKWKVSEVEALFELPFMDLVWRAQQVHRQHFDAYEILRSTLLSVKTGGCSEDLGYW